MVQRPKPVVMVSSLTEEGAEATFEALELGAVDYVRKPDGTISLDIALIERELVSKVRAAATSRVRGPRGLSSRLVGRRQSPGRIEKPLAPLSPDKQGLVLIGVSTGGPGTLEEILSDLPAGFPWPVVVAQHMPGSFTGVFARRLASLCRISVSEVSRQTRLEAANVYIAKGDADLVFSKVALGIMALPAPSSPQHLWHPSVTRMVESAMAVFPPERLIGVQLTGMGDDGAKAMTTLHKRGGRTIAQDEASSVVYGMPGELVRLGGADTVLPAGRIATQLKMWLGSVTAHGDAREAGHGLR